jgi:hypothetical protein
MNIIYIQNSTNFTFNLIFSNFIVLSNYEILNTIIDYQFSRGGFSNFNDSRFFISDLDHCKGFEFDTVVIINANNHVIPSHKKSITIFNEGEDYSNSDISKFYVAMTRAKTNLIISHSGELTEFLAIPEKENYFNEKNSWGYSTQLNKINVSIDKKSLIKNPVWTFTGRDFLFTDYAIGLSKESQEKLIKIVTGKSVDSRKGEKL